jgi:hypothetical protein
MIDEALPNASVDTPITLVIDGISTELTGFVARKSETATLTTKGLSATRCFSKALPEWWLRNPVQRGQRSSARRTAIR